MRQFEARNEEIFNPDLSVLLKREPPNPSCTVRFRSKPWNYGTVWVGRDLKPSQILPKFPFFQFYPFSCHSIPLKILSPRFFLAPSGPGRPKLGHPQAWKDPQRFILIFFFLRCEHLNWHLFVTGSDWEWHTKSFGSSWI